MKFQITALVAVCLFLNIASAQEKQTKPINLKDVKLNLENLRKWGTREYFLYQPKKENSRENIVLLEKPPTRDSNPLRGQLKYYADATVTIDLQNEGIILEQRTYVVYGITNKSTFTWRADCKKNNTLSIKRIESYSNLPVYSRKVKTTSIIKGNQMTVVTKWQDREPNERTRPWRNVDAVPERGLMALVTILPRNIGARYLIDELIDENGASLGQHIITCMKRETITIADKKISCIRFELNETAQPISNIYWVSDDGVLQRKDSYSSKVRMELKPLLINLKRITFDFNQLKDWGTRQYYAYELTRKPAPKLLKGTELVAQLYGLATMSSEVEHDRVSFKYEIFFMQGELRKSTLAWEVETKKNSTFSILRTSSKSEMPLYSMRSRSWSTVEGDHLTRVIEKTGMDQRVENLPWKENSTPEMAIAWLVTLLPHTKGMRYRIDTLVDGNHRDLGSHIIICMERESITILESENSLDCVRFEMKANGQPADCAFWVSDDGLLQRMDKESNRLRWELVHSSDISDK